MLITVIMILASVVITFYFGFNWGEEAMTKASFVLGIVVGFVTFREVGYDIVRLLYSGVPTAEELGGKVHLNLSLSTLPLLLMIICIIILCLRIFGFLGESLGD